jgi:HD-GYP domain-containing protein (c-di-GMP phosphodiesterase class II)
MKEHPVRGDEMLAPLTWLAGARMGVRHHHERVDGTGYPDGLKGDAIPLIARIIALADTFDAVVSRRSYRNERDSKLALEVLKEAAGTQLDRRLVGVFDQHFAQILALLRSTAIPPEGLFALAEVPADASAREAA